MPERVPLGYLELLPTDPQAERKRIPFQSDFARDFSSEPFMIEDASGKPVHVGYRYTSGDTRLTLAHGDFLTKPLYLDAHRLVVGTPSGFLLGIDTEIGRSEVVHDFHARINDLQLHPDKRLLLAGGEDGLLTVLTD